MKSKRIFLVIISLMLLFLCSCQLAMEDGGLANTWQPDRLIGVYATPEPLDLFDTQAWLNDNINSIRQGSSQALQMKVPTNGSDDYNGRIYASRKEGSDGSVYQFDDIKGIMMIMPTVYGEKPEDNYTTSTSDAEVADIAVHAGDHQRLEGTIYVSDDRHAQFFCNPIYQSSDGSVYLISGQGISGNLTDGSSFSMSLKEDYTTTQNSEKTEQSMEISVTLKGKQLCENYELLQMDSDDKCIEKTYISIDNLPSSIHAAKETAYMILVADEKTSDEKERTIYSLSDDEDLYIPIYVPGDKGALIPASILIKR